VIAARFRLQIYLMRVATTLVNLDCDRDWRRLVRLDGKFLGPAIPLPEGHRIVPIRCPNGHRQ
jgi:hypothetical protein